MSVFVRLPASHSTIHSRLYLSLCAACALALFLSFSVATGTGESDTHATEKKGWAEDGGGTEGKPHAWPRAHAQGAAGPGQSAETKNSNTYVDGIHVLNPQSYPVVGGYWTVQFVTTGTHDLTVSAANGTALQGSAPDIYFDDLDNGTAKFVPSVDGDRMVFSDYSSNGTGHLKLGVNTAGVHNIFLEFGPDVAYAANSASYASVTEINSLSKNRPVLDNNGFFGMSVAPLGDLNGDGVPDLAVGAPRDDDIPDKNLETGAVHIMLMNRDGTVKQIVEISNMTTNGPQLDTRDEFGMSVASAGDLDGNGMPDMVVGARWDDSGGNDAGAVHVVLLNRDGAINDKDGTLNVAGLISRTVEINGTSQNGPQLESFGDFGRSVASLGDLNGDGVPDLAAGASKDGGMGTVHIMLMNRDGTVKQTVEINNATMNGPALADGDRFGESVALLEDLNGDGVPDLAVGAPGDDAGGSQAGAVHIMLMNRDGAINDDGTLNVAGLVSRTVEINGTVQGGGPRLDNGDNFGVSVAPLGDLDGDGVPDLVVGAPWDDAGGGNRGAVHIMLMNRDGTVKHTAEINGGAENDLALADGDNFGVSVASLGDLDGDGTLNLAVGANQDDAGGANRGTVHIIPVNADGLIRNTMKIDGSSANGPRLDANDGFGVSVAPLGDLNGDGVPDMAAGATGDDAGGANSGAVHVMFRNRDHSIGSTVEINNMTANGPRLDANDGFGVSVAPLGDLDGDGVPDMAVGAPGDNGAGGSNRGAVHIMLMNRDGTVKQTVEINDTTMNGPALADGDRFGSSVALLRDLDGDGVPALAVGANGDDAGGANSGAVHIMFMNRDSITNVDGLVNRTVEINSTTANGPRLNNDDVFGTSLAYVGDLDGDGVPDLAAGAPWDDAGGVNRGAVHVMLMNRDGSIKRTAGIDSGTENGPRLDNEDFFGVSVASLGDLNGDGVPDMAVGATGDDAGGDTRGAVHVMLMNTDGTVMLTTETHSNSENGPPLDDGDRFGFSVAYMGDLDGDGVPDMAAGATGDDAGGKDRGAVHVIPVDFNRFVLGTVKIDDTTDNGPGLDDNDIFGVSVSFLGDLDGDGVPDLAAGASSDDHNATLPDTGAAYVMMMNRDGTVKGTTKIAHSLNGGPSLNREDGFGVSVAHVGDWNGDGVPDMAVGVYKHDGSAGGNSGTAYLMLMTNTGTANDILEIKDPDDNFPLRGEQFGWSLTPMGDINGDGITDMAVGAPSANREDSPGNRQTGAVYVMLMKSNAQEEITAKIPHEQTGGPSLDQEDRFGTSVASLGDINGDGVPDMAVGAGEDDCARGNNCGAVYVMTMKRSGAADSTTKIAHNLNGGPSLSMNDRFGTSVASLGDINGDGVPDMAVGAGKDDAGGSDEGSVYVMLMNSNGSAKLTVEIHNKIKNGPVTENLDEFGTSVTSADINGDGVADLAVGAKFDDTGGDNRGAVHIVTLGPAFTDRTLPALDGAVFYKDEGILTLSFNDAVDVTPPGNVMLGRMLIGGMSLAGAALGTTSDNSTISITLTPAQLLHAADLVAPRLDIEAGAVRGTLANPIATSMNNTITVIDNTPPALEGAVLNEDTSVLTLSFNDAADVTPPGNVMFDRFIIGWAGGVTLEGAALGTTSDSAAISITLTPTQLLYVKAFTAPKIYVEAGAVRDTSGNQIEASANNTITVIDNTPPALEGAVLNEDTSVLTLSFNDAIDMTSGNVMLGRFLIGEAGGTNRVALAGATLNTIYDDAAISITLTPAQLMYAADLVAPRLDIRAGAVRDISTSRIAASANNTITVIDNTPPALEEAVLDKDTRVLTLLFNDAIDMTSGNVMLGRFLIGEAGGTNRVALAGATLGTTSDSAAISITLTPAQFLHAAALVEPRLDIVAGAVRDTSGNQIEASANNTITVIDNTSLALEGTVLYEDTGILALLFNDTVDVTPPGNVMLGRFLIGEAGGTNRVALAGATLNTIYDDAAISITLTPAQFLHAADLVAPRLDIAAGAVRDTSGNQIEASIGNPVTIIGDTPPAPPPPQIPTTSLRICR